MFNELNDKTESRTSRSVHPVWYLAIALALMGNVALLIHSHRLARSLADLQSGTDAKMNRISEQLAQNRAASDGRVADVAREVRESARESIVSAQENALRETRKSQAALAAKLAETRAAGQQANQQMAGQVDELKLAQNSTVYKLNEVSGDECGVKGDVASAKSELEGHGAELKRVNGDMGVMSGLIATNGKELAALRDLGERNYVEFHLKKKSEPQKIGGLQLSLAKADAKRNRFTLNVLADDKMVEKRDRTINEPVQLYLSGSRQPVEIVVNEVKKDEVIGYLAVPKVTTARR